MLRNLLPIGIGIALLAAAVGLWLLPLASEPHAAFPPGPDENARAAISQAPSTAGEPRAKPTDAGELPAKQSTAEQSNAAGQPAKMGDSKEADDDQEAAAFRTQQPNYGNLEDWQIDRFPHLSQEEHRNVQNFLKGCLRTLVRGELKSIRSCLTADDRARFSNLSELRTDNFSAALSLLKDKWRNIHARSFEALIAEAYLDMQAYDGPTRRRAVAVLDSKEEHVVLLLIQEGIGSGKWRIDAPNHLTPRDLRAKLDVELRRLNGIPAPAAESDALRLLAASLLRPLGSPAASQSKK